MSVGDIILIIVLVGVLYTTFLQRMTSLVRGTLEYNKFKTACVVLRELRPKKTEQSVQDVRGIERVLLGLEHSGQAVGREIAPACPCGCTREFCLSYDWRKKGRASSKPAPKLGPERMA